jgi:hypothetical protein
MSSVASNWSKIIRCQNFSVQAFIRRTVDVEEKKYHNDNGGDGWIFIRKSCFWLKFPKRQIMQKAKNSSVLFIYSYKFLSIQLLFFV